MGYSINKVCQILNLPRFRYYRLCRVNNSSLRISTLNKSSREESIIREKIISICLRYPKWDSRHVRNWLRRREDIKINRKRVQRIMREEKLTLKTSCKKASRDSGRKKPIATRLHQWWGIDMTKFLVESVGWDYLVAVIDWYSRKVVGYALAVHCRSDLWTKALEEAVKRNLLFPKKWKIKFPSLAKKIIYSNYPLKAPLINQTVSMFLMDRTGPFFSSWPIDKIAH